MDPSLLTTCESLVREHTLRLLGEALQRDDPSFGRCVDAILSKLEYHRRQFLSADKPHHGDYVLQCLQRGQFAFGKVAACNWIEDVILATLLALRHEGGTKAFCRTFHSDFAAWGRRFAPNEPDLVDDFPSHLLSPRTRSGPPIETYRARGPLKTWLRRVFRNVAEHMRRSPGEVAVESIGRTDNWEACIDNVRHEGGFVSKDYDRQLCREKLAPIFVRCFDILNARERTVVLQAIVDGVEQKMIARELKIHPGNVARMKQAALAKLLNEFHRLALESSGLQPESIGICVNLLLESVGESVIDLEAVRQRGSGAQLQSTEGSTDVEKRS